MATPSGNSPSLPASTEGSGRNKRELGDDPPTNEQYLKLEDHPPTYEKYLQLKIGFLNSHARICDICKGLIYVSREEPQSDYAYDSHSNSLTETQVGDMVLGHLDAIYRKVMKDLNSKYCYPEADATTAVLATGICYGCKDPIGNALRHALIFLECGLKVDKPKRQNISEELKTLVKFVSMTVYGGWKKKYPYLRMDDFLLWLLVFRKKDPSDASALASYPFDTSGNTKVSSWSICLQCKEESTPNSSTIQFMSMAAVTEDDNSDASSPRSENASESEVTDATGIPGLASGRFTTRTSLSLTDSNPNAAKENPMSSFDSLIDNFSSLTISESSNPEEKSVYVDSKDADGSRRGTTDRRPERRHQARLVGTARKVLKSTKSTMLDSNCSLPNPHKKVGQEPSQSFGSFASSLFSMNIVDTTTTSLSHATNVDAFTSIPSKSNSDVGFEPDYIVASITYVPEKLLSRVDYMQLQLEYWTKWAHHMVLQATNRLNKDKAELQSLRQRKLEAKKEAAALTKSTTRKIGEMDEALTRAKMEVKMAGAAIRKFKSEKIRVEEVLEAAKVRASKSAANYQEASLKESMALKKVETFERERALFQDEVVREKRVLSKLQKQLQQAQMSHGQVEVITS